MSDSFLEAAAIRAAGKLVTEARCEVLLFGCCRSPELAITIQTWIISWETNGFDGSSSPASSCITLRVVYMC